MVYYREPTALYGDDHEPTVLAVVNVHFGELFPGELRKSIVADPIPGVAIIDGFPEAASQGDDITLPDGVSAEANLTL